MPIVPIMVPAAGSTADQQTTAESTNTLMEVQPSMENVTATMDAVELDPKPVSKAVDAPTTKPIRGTTVRMSVPLDTIPEDGRRTTRQTTVVNGHRTLLRRDSLERREALLKGKEGSRQRRRWENDRLLSNPWAEPPLPSDWEVRPTYPRRSIPYYLAPLWDAAEFQRAIESKMKGNRRNSVRHRKKHGAIAGSAYTLGMSPMEEAATMIPKEVKARLKHSRSAKGLLQDLEESVRDFVKRWNAREMKMRQEGLQDAPVAGAVSDEEDEEIVFVGRHGTMHDTPQTPKKDVGLGEDDNDEDCGILEKEKLVFEGLEGDKGAAFGRWLVHCVGNYYGLKTWSVTKEIEGEHRREAYVGVDSRVRGWMGRGVEVGREIELPRPLWCIV